MRNCFVPGCDQRRKNNAKRPMFLVPKNEEMFKKWMEVLPKLRTLKAQDKVCHLHFREEDIESTYNHNINGVLYQLERGRPRLKQDAVPTENLPTAEELSLKLKPTKRLVRKTDKKTAIENASTAVAQESSVTVMDIQEELVVSHEDVENSPAEETFVTEALLAAEEQSLTLVDNIFSLYYDNSDQVQLPNTLWAVHRCPQRSALYFSYMDTKFMRCTKVLKIGCDGTVKISVFNNLLNEFSLTECAQIHEMTEILEQLDAVEFDEEQTEIEEVINEEINEPYELIETE